jgi:hypothetical protein
MLNGPANQADESGFAGDFYHLGVALAKGKRKVCVKNPVSIGDIFTGMILVVKERVGYEEK